MIIFNDAQTGGWGFLVNHKDEQELAIQMPTGSGKTYLIKYLTLNGEFENITIIVMSRLIVVRQTYCQYYKNNDSLQIVFYCSEDDRDDDSNGDDDDFEMPKLDTNSTNKRKIILTTYVSFPKLVDYLKQTKQVIDMTIFDEAHNCNGEKVSRILNDETEKTLLGKIRYFSATLNRDINRGILFDYSFSKAVQNRIIRDFDIQCVIAPKGTEHNEHNYLLGEITKIARSTKTCRYLGFCQWSEAERDTGSNVRAMVNEFQKCSNGNWIEGVTGKDPRKQRDAKLKKFQQEEHTDNLLKLLISCRSLAEGVDLKNVHGCMLFDPRQSEIEIKQIIGRSVRPLRDEDNNALPWDQQTLSNIILPLYFDPEKVQTFKDNVEDESNYLKDQILKQEDGMFATVINVIAVLKEYEPLFQFKFYLKRQKSKDDNDKEELIPVIPDNDDDLTTTTNKIVKKVVLSCSDEMLTLLRMNPHKLKHGLMQLEMGLHDGSVNAFFRKEDFFKKIQKCYECLKKYSEEFKQHLEQDPTIKWIQKKCFGVHHSWFRNNSTFITNTDNQYDSLLINRYLELKNKFMKLQEDEKRIEATIRFDFRLGQAYESLNNYSEEFKQHLEQDPTIKWNQKKCVGEYFSWFHRNSTHITNTDNQYDNKEVNRYPGLKNKFMKLQEDERRLEATIRFDVRLRQAYESLNNYSEEFKQHLEQDRTIKWNQKKCVGEYYSWFSHNSTYITNTDNQYDNKDVNRYPELKNKFMKLKEDEKRLEATIRFDVRLRQAYESLNNYGEEFKQHLEQDPTIKWNQRRCFGKYYNWVSNNRACITNTDNKHDNKEVNRFPELKDKFLKLQEDEKRLKKKTILELKNDNMSTNDDDMDDNEDADDQESLITMTSDINNDQESSRKRKRGALEEDDNNKAFENDREYRSNELKLVSTRKEYFTPKQKEYIKSKQDYKCMNSPGSEFERLYEYQCPCYKRGGDGSFDRNDLCDIDHIVATNRGGTSNIDNGMALCLNCHRVKTNYEKKNKNSM